MQFKNPEILYALFLLLIPIIVHLFQLRRFKKVEFTNVKFLQRVKMQTRKSSQLKKWLTLFTRLLLLGCLILAFAQPYFSKKNTLNKSLEYVIYLDNSFSMEAKGASGELLKRAVQDLINEIPENQKFTLFTNDNVFNSTTINSVKNDLLTLNYSARQLDFNAVLLKGKQFFSKNNSTLKHFVYISDFQRQIGKLPQKTDSTYALNLVKLKPNSTVNINLDTVYIHNKNKLRVILNSNSDTFENTVVSLYNNNNLVAKASSNSNDTILEFSLPKNAFNGELRIEDNALSYDNSLYFNIEEPPKIKVLAINEVEDTYLKRIFTDDEFVFTSKELNQLNYSLIADNKLIILNELKSINEALITAIKSFVSNGGYVIIIPSNLTDISSYNSLLNEYSISFNKKQTIERSISTINFSHPLYYDVFDAKINNFQFPKVNSYYTLNSLQPSILSYDNEAAFLTSYNNVFVFSSALQTKNSNFKNSPLIVPTFYNIGKQSLASSKLYYQILRETQIDVDKSLPNDAVLTLKNENESFIPLQQIFSNKTRVTTLNKPDKAGIYAIKLNTEHIQDISFNYNRKESELAYFKPSELSKFTVNNTIPQYFNTIKNDTNINALWKWFVIFALLFLVLEMVILKYFK